MRVRIEFEEPKQRRWQAVMLTASLITALMLIVFTFARAENDYSQYTDEQITEAIGKAENSKKYPYGIKSLKYEDRTDKSLTKEQWARQICFNSVRNNRKRWIKAGRPGDLITFIRNRFCPLNATDDPKGLNKYWVNNVKYFLDKEKNK